MVANPGDPAGRTGRAEGIAGEEPPAARRSAAGRRRRPWREPPGLWWAAFALLLIASWWLTSWRLALLTLLLWCLYEFALIPVRCRVATRNGVSCDKQVRGRLFACGPAHQGVKNDALWRLARLPNPFRRRALPDPNRETGVVVYSPAVRGQLAPADRRLILLAGLGTLASVAGMLYGF